MMADVACALKLQRNFRGRADGNGELAPGAAGVGERWMLCAHGKLWLCEKLGALEIRKGREFSEKKLRMSEFCW